MRCWWEREFAPRGLDGKRMGEAEKLSRSCSWSVLGCAWLMLADQSDEGGMSVEWSSSSTNSALLGVSRSFLPLIG